MNHKTMRTDLRVAVAVLVLFVWSPESPAFLKKAPPPPEHYRVVIDPNAALKDLLPTPPKDALPGGALLVEDLASVPDVQLHERVIVPHLPAEMLDKEKQDRLRKEHFQALEKATVHTARLTAHINFVNRSKNDRFLELLIDNRPDLAGLPFVMGDACRLKAEDRKEFNGAVMIVQGVTICSCWSGYDAHRKHPFKDLFCTAACMQMLALESPKVRLGLVERLAAPDKSEPDRRAAIYALTRLAVFSQEDEVRRAAIDALRKHGRGPDDTIVLHGLRYPWPSVAQNTAELINELKLKDLIPELIKLLDEPDPRAPAVQEIKGKKTPVLREVVRINHHRNCLLCHPPGNTPDVMTIEPLEEGKKEIEKGVEWMRCKSITKQDDVLVGAVPTPGAALPSASDGYRRFSSPDILVRADITYLRQDFSLSQKVADAAPWPEMQRFDYLVRSRTLTEEQAAAYHAEFAKRMTPSPYREAALVALRRLTRQDAGMSAAAWREALGTK